MITVGFKGNNSEFRVSCVDLSHENAESRGDVVSTPCKDVRRNRGRKGQPPGIPHGEFIARIVKQDGLFRRIYRI